MKKISAICLLAMIVIGGCAPSHPPKVITPSPFQSTKLNSISASTRMPTAPASSTLGYTIEGDCIVYQTPWSFEVGEGGKSIPTLPDIHPVGWQAVSNMPESLYKKIAGQGTKIILRATNRGNNQIWFYTYSDVVIYQIETSQWIQGPTIHGGRLFASKDGEIWMLEGVDGNQMAMLSRLDESKNLFEPVYDRNGILKSGEPGDVVVDANGRFWFFVVDNYIRTLHSFDPATLDARTYNFSSRYFQELVVDDQGNLYTMEGLDALTKFTPTDNKVDSVEIPTDYKSFGYSTSLYIDSSDRLWISDRTWFDLSHQRLSDWSIIVRSPIFIDNVEGYGENYWTRPEVQLESLDGLLWFRFMRGVVSFNAETGKWCLVTTYPARVIEDSQRNLWMFIDGTLYKREASQ